MAINFKKLIEPSAKFNMALATLERMHTLMRLSTITYLEGKDYVRMYEIEKELWMEVRPYSRKRKEDDSGVEDLFKELEPIYNNMIFKKGRDRSPRFFTSNEKDKEEYGTFLNKLNELRQKIRVAMDELGLLMPRTDDPRFAAYG